MAISNVINANEASFDKLLASTSKPVLVDFYADWCGPCKMLGPILEQLSRDYKDVLVVKIDVDSNQNLAAKFGIRSIPTMIIFKDSENKETLNGVMTQPQLEAKLKQYS
ncbi:thioredoxin [Francisella adeliensis]|uniref:Thioredoxin n=1 Tax=Francisella adeliensis TaxID=2007306 RepID=A0A2Z4XZS8_9GAMM|nr:thioredoxin [Francisella adeliensis]AXA33943.1 thioredoxin [Francisella adeliensis]MBK2085851.1 thioredoxin [Francisella adeliensis]MBK2097729.1 thioredoxin [Francisella adeliensis]QIW12179.1 thioredoxin [Francisella adeliensis]QIW14055.1 thioredoxin [Francisella adeliensis]